jgi:hypothetical protein
MKVDTDFNIDLNLNDRCTDAKYSAGVRFYEHEPCFVQSSKELG